MNYRLIKQYPGSPPLGEEWDENTEVKTLTSSTLEEYQSTGIKIKDLPEYWQPVEFTLPEKYKVMRTLENYNIINNYVRDLFKKMNPPTFHRDYIAIDKKSWYICFNEEDYTEITFEQFKKYVLKENDEVVKDYEILSFKDPDNKLIYINQGDSYCKSICQHYHTYIYCLKYYQIHSIRRLSDDEIFTIGDKTYDGKITKFELNNNNSINVFIENVTWIKLDLLIKSKTPLFKTEDGVDIFEGDKLYSICNMLNIKKHRLFNARYDDNTLLNNRIFFNSDYKHFSTKEKAEEYIIENKPVLSLNDILNLKKKGFARNSTIFHEVKELVKQKIKQ